VVRDGSYFDTESVGEDFPQGLKPISLIAVIRHDSSRALKRDLLAMEFFRKL